jgi:SAM-dependent methyltransferase
MTSLLPLASLLQCPQCLATAWSTAGSEDDGAVACDACGAVLPVVDRVLDLGVAGESRSVALEREGVRRTERVPRLGGINDEFDDLSRAEGALKAAILALPYGDDSRYYREPGYFSNVRASCAAFDFVARHLDANERERLLDVGADLTWSTSQMARRGLDCTALDINHHLGVGRLFATHFNAPYHLVRGDMARASFRTAAFDIVVAINALHHAIDLDQAIGNIARMLRPGGRLGFIEPYCATEEAKAEFGRAQIEAGVSEHTYLLPEWHRTLVNAGLRTRVLRVADSFSAVYDKAPGGSLDLFERFYQGRLSLLDGSARTVAAGGKLQIPLALHNTGNSAWCSSSQFPVFASYHLHRCHGTAQTMVAFDNPRTPLPSEVGPGDETTMVLWIATPGDPGEYVAEIDLVHEYVAWFAAKGLTSPTIRFRVV